MPTTDNAAPAGEPRHTTVSSHEAADRWLDGLEHKGLQVQSSSLSTTDGGKIRVTAMVIKKPPRPVARKPAQPAKKPRTTTPQAATPTPEPAPQPAEVVQALDQQDSTIEAAVCAGPGCDNPLPARVGGGRVREFCSARCRQAAHRSKPNPADLAGDAVTTMLHGLAGQLNRVTAEDISGLDPAAVAKLIKHVTALAKDLPAPPASGTGNPEAPQ